MEITEEASRRSQTLRIEDTERAYSELRDLLENRIGVDSAHEEKYYNDIEKGEIRAKIICGEGFDQHSSGEYEVFLTLNRSEGTMDLQVKGKVVTSYPNDKDWQNSLWYYAYRSLFDKFLYGSAREGYEHAVEHRVDAIMKRTRETLEAKNG